MNAAQRILIVPWALFSTVVVAAYTANLAAFLSKEDYSIPYANIEECMTKGCTFCTTGYSLEEEALDLYYPSLSRTIIPVDAWDIISNLNKPGTVAESCDATLYVEKSVEMDVQYAQDPECSNMFTGRKLFAFNVGWPVRNEIAPTLNLHLKDALNDGVWETLRTKYTPAKTCDYFQVEDDSADALSQMTSMEFLGPLLLLGVGTFGAMFLYIYYKGSGTQIEEKTEEEIEKEAIAKDITNFIMKRIEGHKLEDLDAGGIHKLSGSEPAAGIELGTMPMRGHKRHPGNYNPIEGQVLLENRWLEAMIYPSFHATVLDSPIAKALNVIGQQIYDVPEKELKLKKKTPKIKRRISRREHDLKEVGGASTPDVFTALSRDNSSASDVVTKSPQLMSRSRTRSRQSAFF